ncbi:LUD domain-containing protein [Ochrovirga pacifica]|uniref:LUD domain-containing protein n=1 Tax=Ochrovirga pacifica TaxID=1042376 RepID=UPI000255A79B|nr:LUD domain-containing protein [Ochrovirga pacifica]
MNFFKKLFKSSNNTTSSKEEKAEQPAKHTSLDDLFVHHFIHKEGKFLYCLSTQEALETLKNILQENQWNSLTTIQKNLMEICQQNAIFVENLNTNTTFFTTCEHLLADSGNILLSSNQLGEMKLSQLNENFIVWAYTSQIVKDMREGLTGIKTNNKGKIPTNICDIRNYTINQSKENNFMDYGISNSKNLYLILVEDL